MNCKNIAFFYESHDDKLPSVVMKKLFPFLKDFYNRQVINEITELSGKVGLNYFRANNNKNVVAGFHFMFD